MSDKPDIRRDWTHEFSCGCKVTFLGSCFHKSSRTTCCAKHSKRDQIDLRTRMIEEAKGHYELAMVGRLPAMFKDAADDPEDLRIAQIGKAAMAGNLVAFITDDDPGKAERYIEKLLTRFPELRVIDRFPGPIDGAVSVRVCRKDTVNP